MQDVDLDKRFERIIIIILCVYLWNYQEHVYFVQNDKQQLQVVRACEGQKGKQFVEAAVRLVGKCKFDKTRAVTSRICNDLCQLESKTHTKQVGQWRQICARSHNFASSNPFVCASASHTQTKQEVSKLKFRAQKVVNCKLRIANCK